MVCVVFVIVIFDRRCILLVWKLWHSGVTCAAHALVLPCGSRRYILLLDVLHRSTFAVCRQVTITPYVPIFRCQYTCHPCVSCRQQPF
jgi:hypothetical protein